MSTEDERKDDYACAVVRNDYAWAAHLAAAGPEAKQASYDAWIEANETLRLAQLELDKPLRCEGHPADAWSNGNAAYCDGPCDGQ